ncbi:heat shock protein Hsp15, partial [Streptomyces sp. Ncost-T6T-2b]
MVSGDAPQAEGSVRVDVWIWSVRLTKTRAQAAAACRAGHVKVGGDRAKPAQAVRVGDEVRLRHAGRDRVVVVSKIVKKRVGPPVAVECFVDNSPPPPPPRDGDPGPCTGPGCGPPDQARPPGDGTTPG